MVSANAPYAVRTSISRNDECRSALGFLQFRCLSFVLDAFNMPTEFFGSCSRGNRLEWISFIITFHVASFHHKFSIYFTRLLPIQERTHFSYWPMHFHSIFYFVNYSYSFFRPPSIFGVSSHLHTKYFTIRTFFTLNLMAHCFDCLIV